MTDIKLPEELRKLDVALRRLRDQTDILNTFEAWYFLFEHYYNENIRDLESESVSRFFSLQSGWSGCRAGNRKKLSSSQATLGQAIYLAVA